MDLYDIIPSHLILNFNDFQLKKFLTYGTNSLVYSGIRKSDEKEVMIKFFGYKSDDNKKPEPSLALEKITNEIRSLYDLRDGND